MPIYLIKNGIAIHAIAADINELPLKNAYENINKYGVSKDVEIRLSNGLSNILNSEVDTIIIAGMGGELITQIIDDSKFCKDKNKTFILQPMTRSVYLREYLLKHGFNIQEEIAVTSGKHVYTVIKTIYSGLNTLEDDIYKYIGALDIDNLDIPTVLYIEKQIRNLTNKLKGTQNNYKINMIIQSLQNIINKDSEIND